MPKKLRQETQAQQSERFKKDAQKLIDAGELNPTEAEKALENLVQKQREKQAENLAEKVTR